METKIIAHEPREGAKGKPFSYTQFIFANLDEALRHFEFREDVKNEDGSPKLGEDGTPEFVTHEDKLIAFFNQEATRRSKVNENAKVNGGVEAKTPVEKLIGMATRIFTPGNETGYVLTKAEAKAIREAYAKGDKAPAQALKARYQEALDQL